MKRHFGKVVLTAGIVAALGLGLWNVVEVRKLREELSKQTESRENTATKDEIVPPPPKVVPDMDVPKELILPTNPPVTVAPPDILQIDVKAEGLKKPPRGEFLIRPDGTVGLAEYGSAYVAGMTLPQVKAAITKQLNKSIPDPEVSVDVVAFNSKSFYVIYGSPDGESVARFPSTGNETVADAIAMIGGLREEAAKRKVWVARRGAR